MTAGSSLQPGGWFILNQSKQRFYIFFDLKFKFSGHFILIGQVESAQSCYHTITTSDNENDDSKYLHTARQ